MAPPTSTAPYIIICSGRIAVASTNSPREQRVVSAAACAAQFAAFMEGKYGDAIKDEMATLAEIQHYLMEHIHDMNNEAADLKIAELFAAMNAIETEYQ